MVPQKQLLTDLCKRTSPMRRLPAFLFLCSISFAAVSRAEAPVANFRLKDTAGKIWSLDETKDRKAVVVVFLGTQCPINNAYLPRLAELCRTYEPRGVQFVAINANDSDTPAAIAEHARAHKLPFPVLRDEAQVATDRLGAKRTPEAILLDGKRQIRYRGRIDDQFGVGFQRPEPTRRDLVEALDEVLAGRDVSQALTPVQGCLITRKPQPGAERSVTFSKHVARILQEHCQECHRPGQIGPMALLTYDDAASWAAMIREVVQEKRMPPWHADPKHGKFRNDRTLPSEAKQALLAWIDQGCPKGDATDLPAPRQFSDSWFIGKPDAVVAMPRPFTVPATTTKKGLRYQYFAVPTNFTEDVWIQAAEAKPGNRAVVHHIIVYIVKDGKRAASEDGIGNGYLVAYAPGGTRRGLPCRLRQENPQGRFPRFPDALHAQRHRARGPVLGCLGLRQAASQA